MFRRSGKWRKKGKKKQTYGAPVLKSVEIALQSQVSTPDKNKQVLYVGNLQIRNIYSKIKKRAYSKYYILKSWSLASPLPYEMEIIVVLSIRFQRAHNWTLS